MDDKLAKRLERAVGGHRGVVDLVHFVEAQKRRTLEEFASDLGEILGIEDATLAQATTALGELVRERDELRERLERAEQEQEAET